MRICIVTPEILPFTRLKGGIGAQMGTLVPALAAAGHEVHVIYPVEGPIPQTPDRGFDHHPVSRPQLGRFFPLSDPVVAARIPRRVRSLGRLDVIVATEYAGHARHLSRRNRPGPLVTSLQSSLEQIMRMTPEAVEWRTLRVQNRLQRRAERAQALRSDAILGCSNSILDWAERLWPLGHLPREVLPNVLDVRRIRALASSAAVPDVPGDGPLVAFSGRLESRKGVDVLVRAMGPVWDDVPEARLVLAGRDVLSGGAMMSAKLRGLAGAHSERLIFLGSIEPDALMSLLSRADIVATPSRWEAFGLATFEALALGAPTIATAAGGFADFLEAGKEAMLVPPDDPGALGEAILGLMRDPARRRTLGEAGAKRAEGFDVSIQLPRYVEYFERIAGA
jgi:glycosyltransferase involved in cell wall biosynthesis